MIARLCIALVAGLALAQNSPPLEIRGTVVEGGLGVAAATVTLYEFGHTPAEATTRTVFGTTSTDSKGSFVFHPARTGEYYVEVQKDGYFAESFDGPAADPMDSTGDAVSIDSDHPSQGRRFSLIRLGEIHGRVIDEYGNPMAKLRVGLRPATSTQVVTDQDGYFLAAKLRPGDYQVWIVPQQGSPQILPQFLASDLEIIDQDLESSSSPGTPLPVSPGASLSVGTITVHKKPYYRAHLLVQADCAPDENWLLTIRTGDASDFGLTRRVPCGKEFLVRNLASGVYSFVLATDERRGEEKRWAIVPVEVTDHNLDVTMIMSPGSDISGRLIAAKGAALPRQATVVVMPLLGGLGFVNLVTDANGTFRVLRLPGDRNRVSVHDMGDKFYVKEIRYNGLSVSDDIFTPVAGPTILEIVIDDKAATVSGSVAERDKLAGPIMIVAVKWPLSLEESLPPLLLGRRTNAPADDQGKFRISGLAPGEYRVFALTENIALRLKPDSLTRLVNLAAKVTLEPGSSEDISLKLVEP